VGREERDEIFEAEECMHLLLDSLDAVLIFFNGFQDSLAGELIFILHPCLVFQFVVESVVFSLQSIFLLMNLLK
jgi:hypothetical protein